MSETPKFDLEFTPRLTLPIKLDRVLEGESSIFNPETEVRSTYKRECDLRFFDDGTLTFETTYRGELDYVSSVIDYVRQTDGTHIENPTDSNSPFSSRVVYNDDPRAGFVGQVLDLTGL